MGMRSLAVRLEISVKTSVKHTNLCAECIIAVLTRDGPVMRNTRMAFLAHIFRLIRVAAACAVILALGFALPSAAHAVTGHHGNAAVSHSGESHAVSAMHSAAHDASRTGAHNGQDAPHTADTGNCCSGACMAVAVLTLQPEEIPLTQPVRWKQENSQLPSREQLALLRPPRT